MIAETDARAVLEKNLARTESLISAMEKIYGYNRNYQDSLYQSYSTQLADNPGKNEEEKLKRLKSVQYITTAVKDVQERELEGINTSCGEHAIISLSTAFETYYKELVQELLRLSPDFFVTQNTPYSENIRNLIEEPTSRNYEEIGKTLKLRTRWDYYKFFDLYSIPFLSLEERDFIEQIYIKRNNFVHNAGKEDKKSREKMDRTGSIQNNLYISTEAKKLRTKFKRMMFKTDKKLRLKVIDASP